MAATSRRDVLLNACRSQRCVCNLIEKEILRVNKKPEWRLGELRVMGNLNVNLPRNIYTLLPCLLMRQAVSIVQLITVTVLRTRDCLIEPESSGTRHYLHRVISLYLLVGLANRPRAC